MKIIFAGTPQFAASSLAALLGEHQVVAVLTQPDRPSGRGWQVRRSDERSVIRRNARHIIRQLMRQQTAESASLFRPTNTRFDQHLSVVICG